MRRSLREDLRLDLQNILTKMKLPIVKIDYAGTQYDMYCILRATRDQIIRQFKIIGFSLRLPYYDWLIVMTRGTYKIQIIPYKNYQVIVFDPKIVRILNQLVAVRYNELTGEFK